MIIIVYILIFSNVLGIIQFIVFIKYIIFSYLFLILNRVIIRVYIALFFVDYSDEGISISREISLSSDFSLHNVKFNFAMS